MVESGTQFMKHPVRLYFKYGSQKMDFNTLKQSILLETEYSFKFANLQIIQELFIYNISPTNNAQTRTCT